MEIKIEYDNKGRVVGMKSVTKVEGEATKFEEKEFEFISKLISKSIENNHQKHIVFNNKSSENGSIWVAGSYNSDKGLYYSTDGKTWTQSNITSGDFFTVYYDNGIWVAGSFSDKGLYYSTDGKTWTQSNITSGNFYTVYYDNGIWVGVSSYNRGLYYSEDGKTWRPSNITSGYFREVYYDNGIWVTCNIDDKGLYYSEDGKTWRPSNITSGYFRTVYHS